MELHKHNAFKLIADEEDNILKAIKYIRVACPNFKNKFPSKDTKDFPEIKIFKDKSKGIAFTKIIKIRKIRRKCSFLISCITTF